MRKPQLDFSGSIKAAGSVVIDGRPPQPSNSMSNNTWTEEQASGDSTAPGSAAARASANSAARPWACATLTSRKRCEYRKAWLHALKKNLQVAAVPPLGGHERAHVRGLRLGGGQAVPVGIKEAIKGGFKVEARVPLFEDQQHAGQLAQAEVAEPLIPKAPLSRSTTSAPMPRSFRL